MSASATIWWTIAILLKLALLGFLFYLFFKWMSKRQNAREQERLQAPLPQYYQPNYPPQYPGVWFPQPPPNREYPGNNNGSNMNMPVPPPYAANPPRCGGYNTNGQY
ncbi:hypothetical protein QBC38DRAFT_129539 [Podospora fimiseda]|uniref:Uncharacterized protein n=1 Tax=Podospora fimiseda TaxID=252190 RepID=A0AAN7BD70_9PEZI|nr:hypothetical protein QBC38DRAFT_129539 [Podospora fimiseda]